MEIEKWICLYPIYFDPSRTVKGGRAVRKDLLAPAAACPTALQIYEAVQRTVNETDAEAYLQLEASKRHPRDPIHCGRVRVNMNVLNGTNSTKGYCQLLLMILENKFLSLVAAQLASILGSAGSAPSSQRSSVSTSGSPRLSIESRSPLNRIDAADAGVELVARRKKKRSMK